MIFGIQRGSTHRGLWWPAGVFSKTGASSFERESASLLSASYTSRFILDSRHERETKKLKRTQEEQNLEFDRIYWMTWWEKKSVKMKVWFINITNNYWYYSLLNKLYRLKCSVILGCQGNDTRLKNSVCGESFFSTFPHFWFIVLWILEFWNHKNYHSSIVIKNDSY